MHRLRMLSPAREGPHRVPFSSSEKKNAVTVCNVYTQKHPLDTWPPRFLLGAANVGTFFLAAIKMPDP